VALGLGLGLLAAGTFGCGRLVAMTNNNVGKTRNTPAPQPGPTQEEEQLLASVNAAYVSPQCVRVAEGPPDTEVADAAEATASSDQGATAEQQCGLIAPDVTSWAFVADFITSVCHETAEAVSPACSARYSEMFIARLAERYAMADFAVVSQKCTAYPKECQQFRFIEVWVIYSHNARLYAWYQQQLEQLRMQRQAEALAARQEQERVEQANAEKRARVIRAIAAGLAGMANAGGTQCTSVNMGNITTTSCR
jgi:hypothetical protein